LARGDGRCGAVAATGVDDDAGAGVVAAAVAAGVPTGTVHRVAPVAVLW